jgi:hypothetical protein
MTDGVAFGGVGGGRRSAAGICGADAGIGSRTVARVDGRRVRSDSATVGDEVAAGLTASLLTLFLLNQSITAFALLAGATDSDGFWIQPASMVEIESVVGDLGDIRVGRPAIILAEVDAEDEGGAPIEPLAEF